MLAGWQFAWTTTPLSYLDPIFRGVSLAAHDLGCNVLLGCGMGLWSTKSDSLRPAWPLSSIGAESDFVPIGPWNTDGLIIVNPLHSPARSRYVQELIAAGHSVIFIAGGEHGPAIIADNHSGILAAMQHLAEHGHRQIAFIAGSPEDMAGDTGSRLRAYHEAIKRYGLPTDPRLVAWGRHLYNGGYVAMKKILASGIHFTAVMASNDESAMGAMQALREAGRRIPQDTAIIGFDDRPESAVQEPTLSSVRIPLHKMGYLAAKSLFHYLTGQTDAIESAQVAARLMTRESCGCGSSADRADQPLVRETSATTMSAPILAEAQGLPAEEIEALCHRLSEALRASVAQGERSIFQQTLDAVLRQVTASGDDAHTWQAALSSLGNTLNGLPASDLATAREILDQARITISACIQQQFRQRVVDQHWMTNHLGRLTARLLAALDEAQVYDVLAQHLPTMGIHTAWIALLEANNDDPTAWSRLRIITPLTAMEQPTVRFPSRDFPPADLLLPEQPFRLALFPLTGPRGQLGYVVFDTAHLNLYGAITQQVATALNSAQLYREATEGRRLAEEANALKSRFLSTVSHELRTPLNLIVGLSSILLQESDENDTPLPDPCLADVEQIHTNAQHLSGLIGDVLDLASSDAGQLRLANEFVDLSEALRLVAETGRQLAYDKGLTWRADLPESGPWVWGDRTRLRQVALNLVNNAIKFTAQGEVRLTLEPDQENERVTIMVRDTGLGIPPEEQSAIFDEFRQSERSVAHGYGGLGLGLAICKRLVEMHGGRIEVESSGEEGDGATFRVTLPTVQPPAAQTVQATAPPLTAESILVLTHRTGSGERLREHLTGRGLDVHTAFTDASSDWFSRLVVSPPGAIVIDMSTMPHQGWDVLKLIKGHPKTQHLPVMFYTLSQEGGAVLEFDYLTKPIELTHLTRALDQHWIAFDADRPFKTILIVDDDLNTLDMHARIVQTHSPTHHVLKAQNGLEAVDILKRERVDLVLLDLIMPQLDGFGVLEAMREQERTRDIPVIVLTGQVLTETEMARLSRGVATVLSKDLFSIQETLAHLDAALDRKRKLSHEAQQLVRQAVAYIHTHYADPISRADLARHVALSDDYLTFCFRQELGVTPIAYINRFRVNQAKQLLTDTHKSITEIALDVGFSDSSYFSRIFRRQVGLSPTAYRET